MTSTQRSAADDKAADAEYITAVRGGDTSAFGPLYRRHRAAAYHLARQLVSSPSEAEDLVSESFAKVFNTLLAGAGPDSAFRAYLLTSVRNTFYDALRKGKKLTYTDDLEPHDKGEPFEDPAVKVLDSELAAKAYASLPERWQTVLWHTEIEGESPAQVAPLLGLTANGTAALAYRAREGLKQAFLQAHVADVADDACKMTSERLGAWSRGGLSKREQTQVDRHLEECDRCAAVAAEISDLGAGLRGVVAVLAIGTPALTAAYLTGGSMAKIGALAWAGAAAPAAGFTQISALVTGAGTTVGAAAGSTGTAATTSTAATTAAGVFVKSSSSSAAAAAASGAAHSSLGLWGAVAGTAAVAAIATVVIVSANFGDPAPSAEDVGAAPSTSSSAAPKPQPSPGAASSAPLPSASATAPSTASGSGGFGTSLDDLEDLPSMPPVDDGILGELPSIGALPPVTSGTDSTEADNGNPNPGIAAPAPSNAGDEDTDDGDGTTDTDTDTDTDNGDTDNGDGTTDDGDDGILSPVIPEVTPTPEINAPLDADTNTFVSQPISIAHQGNVDYEQIVLTIPPFGGTDPEDVNQSQDTTCAVDLLYSSGANSIEIPGQPCGDVDEPTSFNLLTADGLTAGESVTVTITVVQGTDITLSDPEDVSLDFATEFADSSEPQNTSVTLVLDTPPESSNQSGESGESATGETTTAGESTSVAPSTTTETTSNSSSSPDPTSGTTTATATD